MTVVGSGSKFVLSKKSLLFRMLTTSNSQAIADQEKSHVTLIKKIGEFVPKLSGNLHKGQCGRIGVIGGSTDYTGAPFYTGISALRTGADLVYIFCCQNVASVIKSYSPELVVCPILDNEGVVRLMEPVLHRLHVLVIGPGLGRDLTVLRNVATIIGHIKERNYQLPLIIDADGLFLVSEHLNLIRDYKGPLILTPNLAEFDRLKSKVSSGDVLQIATELGVVLVQKGRSDLIANGAFSTKSGSKPDSLILSCDLPGSHRRVGGQGDILAGTIATFTAWFHTYLTEVKSTKGHDSNILLSGNPLGYGLPAYAGCAITRACSRLAFKEFGRSTLASDMIPYINKAFRALFGQ